MLAVWADCRLGRFRNEIQAGHPLGFWSHSYAGEVALATIINDPSNHLTALKAELAHYPKRLAEALVAAAWESTFSIANAGKAVDSGDVAYVAGCLFRAVGVLTQAIHGKDRCWLLNEKGAVAATDRLPSVPDRFAAAVTDALGSLGPTREQLAKACGRMQALDQATQQSLG